MKYEFGIIVIVGGYIWVFVCFLETTATCVPFFCVVAVVVCFLCLCVHFLCVFCRFLDHGKFRWIVRKMSVILFGILGFEFDFESSLHVGV